jgi:hypothetical protein
MKTPITDMIGPMMAAGTAPDVILAAVRAVELARDDDRRGRRSTGAVTTASQARGTRLPDDWQPSEQCIAYALDHGMTRDRMMIEAEKFRNYWTAKSGHHAVKRDWGATWRNWILKALETRNVTRNYDGRAYPAARSAPTGANAILAGMGRVARRISAERISKGSNGADVAQELDLEPDRT